MSVYAEHRCVCDFFASGSNMAGRALQKRWGANGEGGLTRRHQIQTPFQG